MTEEVQANPNIPEEEELEDEAPPAPMTMDEHLETVIGVTNETMHDNIVHGGSRSPEVLVTKKKDWVHQCCSNIRKSPGGNQEHHCRA